MFTSFDCCVLTRDDVVLARRIYRTACDDLKIITSDRPDREAIARRVMYEMNRGVRDPGLLRARAVQRNL